MIDFADIIVDLQAGDTGKGKVAHYLASKNGLDKYTHVVRYNGGGNAGHTVYHNGNKIVTHYIPIGFSYRINSIIGPGCVLNVKDLFKEIKELEDAGFNVREYLFIDKRVHIITENHLQEEYSEKEVAKQVSKDIASLIDREFAAKTSACDSPQTERQADNPVIMRSFWRSELCMT